MSFAPGENIGPYRILEEIGQGGMATVFRAYHASLARYVAIKVLHPALKQDRKFAARFEREARIVARLNHPNIIPIYDFAEHEGIPYLVMPYIEGKTLKELLQESRLTSERILAIVQPVAEGLAYAHAQGVLHRDIKPSNIMLADDGHVFIADFGLARLAQARDSTLSKESIIGTPQYLSPEQGKSETLDARSDLYSLGVVLFEMFTGRVPFQGDTPYAIIHDHIFTAPPPPTKINPSLSTEIERVLVKVLSKDRKARFSSATELMEALKKAVGDTAITPTSHLPRIRPAPAAPSPSSVTRLERPQTVAEKDARLRENAVQTAPSRIQPVPGWITRAQRPSLVASWPPWSERENPLWLVLAVVLAIDLLLGCGVVAWARWETIQQTVWTILPSDPVAVARDKVEAHPEDALAHIELAEALASKSSYNDAYEELERAMALDLTSPEGYLRAGAVAEGASDVDRALNYYQRGWQQTNENSSLLLAQARVLGKMGRWEAARVAYDRLLRLEPNSASAMSGLGDYNRAQNRPADALREYTRALVADPNLPDAHLGLGLLAAGRGANEEAKSQLEMVVDNPRSSTDQKELANKQLGLLAK